MARKKGGEKGASPRARTGVFVGRLVDEPDMWFIAWDHDKASVTHRLEDDLGPLDATSIKRVSGAGYFLFRRKSAPSAGLEPMPGEYLILYDDATDRWIARHRSDRREPTPKPARKAKRGRSAAARDQRRSK